MQTGIKLAARSVPATQFTEALAIGVASAMYHLQLPRGAWVRSVFKNILIASKDNCAWELNLFSSANGWTTDPATDAWVGRWQFNEADGLQLNGAGLWRYQVSDVDTLYQDDDALNSSTVMPRLHAVLVNRSAANAKSAGANGAIEVSIILEPMAENG